MIGGKGSGAGSKVANHLSLLSNLADESKAIFDKLKTTPNMIFINYDQGDYTACISFMPPKQLCMKNPEMHHLSILQSVASYFIKNAQFLMENLIFISYVP